MVGSVVAGESALIVDRMPKRGLAVGIRRVITGECWRGGRRCILRPSRGKGANAGASSGHSGRRPDRAFVVPMLLRVGSVCFPSRAWGTSAPGG